jgi:hypothetical protein
MYCTSGTIEKYDKDNLGQWEVESALKVDKFQKDI